MINITLFWLYYSIILLCFVSNLTKLFNEMSFFFPPLANTNVACSGPKTIKAQWMAASFFSTIQVNITDILGSVMQQRDWSSHSRYEYSFVIPLVNTNVACSRPKTIIAQWMAASFFNTVQ